ncbi:hypothetical protein ACIPJQ_03235 [Streptomyces griseoviridis]
MTIDFPRYTMGNAAGTRGTKGDNPENGTRTGTDSSESSATADGPPDGGAPGEKTSEEPEKTSEDQRRTSEDQNSPQQPL